LSSPGSVGAALLVVLETLAPAERLAFVLHDMFAVPFEEIAPIVGRTPAAARQLASRARRQVQVTPADADLSRKRKIVDAFLAASRDGDFEGLLAVRLGSLAEIRAAADVAETFKGRAQAAKPALVDGALALAVIMGGALRIVLRLTITGDRIAEVEAIADAERLDRFDLRVLDA